MGEMGEITYPDSSNGFTSIPQKSMKEATDEHGFSRMIPPASAVVDAGISVFHPC